MLAFEITAGWLAGGAVGLVALVLAVATFWRTDRELAGWLRVYGFVLVQPGWEGRFKGWQGQYKGFVARIREEMPDSRRGNCCIVIASLQLFDPRNGQPLDPA